MTRVLPGADEGEPDDEVTGPGVVESGGVDDPNTGGVADPDPDSSGSGTTGGTPPAPTQAPFASPVPGKFGHVYSPFAKGKEVDVSGYPPGTEVRCPYTQKIFKVP